MDHYRTLGLTHTADANAIRTAYRTLAKRYHPDVSKLRDAHARFLAIAEAYQVLSDPATRARYDRTLQRAAARQAGAQGPATARSAGTTRPRYDRAYSKQRHQARARAEAHSRMPYEEFNTHAFDTAMGYMGPKMLGCAGIGVVAIAVLVLLMLLAGDNPWLGIPVVLLVLFGFIPGVAYASTLFDDWHNEQHASRKPKR